MIEDLVDRSDPDAPSGGALVGIAIALSLEAIAFLIGYFGRQFLLAAGGLR